MWEVEYIYREVAYVNGEGVVKWEKYCKCTCVLGNGEGKRIERERGETKGREEGRRRERRRKGKRQRKGEKEEREEGGKGGREVVQLE